MRVEPDAGQSAEERAVLAHMTQTILARADLTVTPPESTHPAVIETAHVAQRVLRADPSDPLRLRALGRMLERARADIADPPPELGWPVDLVAPRAHLERSVARALKAVPKQEDHATGPPASAVVGWRDADTETIRETTILLAEVWPEACAELGEILVQIALLHGPAIDGFTDFGVHGAVFVRRDRLDRGADGLPGPVRLAEALVHEGAHTRCNAATVAAEPFLRPAEGDGPLVATPLRADPRPLTGLFQQAVVLARSVLLYRHLLDADRPATTTEAANAIRTRHDLLARSATDAVGTLRDHRDALTGHGLSVLDQAVDVARTHG
ncbi:HEXXH motif domain-containing protein [Embleya scabrispora]|uniref:HEXXH motif domain-containing protein n=1 Tax=Embleya scabrispora TaxID=159449 RepID=UPI00037B1A95|nr:HEXXH motif domain-containing protein [Embleya scabrispora]MYS81522.1 HEXXH motif domain-containing protein [Streptomyces sp. SID5474]